MAGVTSFSLQMVRPQNRYNKKPGSHPPFPIGFIRAECDSLAEYSPSAFSGHPYSAAAGLFFIIKYPKYLKLYCTLRFVLLSFHFHAPCFLSLYVLVSSFWFPSIIAGPGSHVYSGSHFYLLVAKTVKKR